MQWRVIYTDTEGMTGVAPACERQAIVNGEHGRTDGPDAWADECGVYDCCPHPHIETYDERIAPRVAQMLSDADAEQCS